MVAIEETPTYVGLSLNIAYSYQRGEGHPMNFLHGFRHPSRTRLNALISAKDRR